MYVYTLEPVWRTQSTPLTLSENMFRMISSHTIDDEIKPVRTVWLLKGKIDGMINAPGLGFRVFRKRITSVIALHSLESSAMLRFLVHSITLSIASRATSSLRTFSTRDEKGPRLCCTSGVKIRFGFASEEIPSLSRYRWSVVLSVGSTPNTPLPNELTAVLVEKLVRSNHRQMFRTFRAEAGQR